MRSRPEPLFRALAFAVLALGCSSEPLDDSASGGAGSTSNGSGAGGGAPGMTCETAGGYPTAAEAQFVGSVQAALVGTDGATPSDVSVQVCGLDLCINGSTEPGGAAFVSVGSDMKLPAFKYGDGVAFGKIALLLPVPTDSVDLGTVYVPALPLTGAPISAGATSNSGGVELEVASGSTVTFDRLTYRTEAEQAFRAAELPVAQAPDGLDPGLGFELYFALGPPDTEFCPPATLAVPNTANFPPGTKVDFYLHGLDVDAPYAPYGGFMKFSEGSVSEDGQSIRSAEQSLPVLSLVAIKRQ